MNSFKTEEDAASVDVASAIFCRVSTYTKPNC